MRFKASLETAANVAMVIAAIAFVAIGVHSWRLGASAPPTLGSFPQYQAGDVLDHIPSIDFEGGDTALVMFVNSACHYCSQSMPFYKRLLTARNATHSRTRVAALAREDLATLSDYLAKSGLVPDQTISLPLDSEAKLSLTPTLLLVGRDHVIRKIWIGALTAAGEKEVFAAIGASSLPS